MGIEAKMDVPKTFIPDNKNLDKEVEGLIAKGLAKDVLEALIVQRAEQDYQLLKDLKYKKLTNEFIEIVLDSINDEEDREKIKPKLHELSVDFSDSKQLRKKAYESAKNYYRTKEDLDLEIEGLCKQLVDGCDIQEKELQEIRETCEGRYDFIKMQGKFIDELVKIAEKEGLETAVAKETEYEVLRRMFPTAEDYFDLHLKFYESTINHFAKMGEVIEEHTYEKSVAETFIGLSKASKLMLEYLLEKIVCKEIKEIYNKEIKLNNL